MKTVWLLVLGLLVFIGGWSFAQVLAPGPVGTAVSGAVILGRLLARPLRLSSDELAGTPIEIPSTAVSGAPIPIPSPEFLSLTGGASFGTGYIEIEAQNGTSVRIPTTTRAAGAPPPPTAQTQASGPQSTYSSSEGDCQNLASAQAACDCHAGRRTASDPSAGPFTSTFLSQYTMCRDFDGLGNIAGGVNLSVSTVNNGCPPGYTLSGFSCTETNPRATSADGKNDVLRSGTTYSRPVGDADENVPGAIKGTINLSGDTFEVAGLDKNSRQPTRLRVQALANGVTEVTQDIQSKDQTGNDLVVTRQWQYNADGQVQSQTQVTTASKLSVSPTTQTATQTSSPPGSLTGSASGPAAAPCEDCAKETTLKEIQKALTDKDSPPPETGTPKTKDEMKAAMPGRPLEGWAVPSHSSACPVMVLDATAFASGWVWTVDGHCPIFETKRAEAATWLDVMWLCLALFIVLGA